MLHGGMVEIQRGDHPHPAFVETGFKPVSTKIRCEVVGTLSFTWGVRIYHLLKAAVVAPPGKYKQGKM
jgi:hypothetical protein